MMRVTVSLCTAMVLALTASGASAMDANEIFSRLKAQAGAAETVQGDGNAVQRGFNTGALYGEPEVEAAPAVAAVPAATPATAQPASTATPTYVSVVEPSAAPAALPTPSYVMESAASTPVQVSAQPAATTPVVSDYVRQQAGVSPSFEPAAVQAPAPTYTAVAAPQTPRPTAASYAAVDQNKRVDLRIFFEWNSASLKPEAIGQLAELCTAIQRVGASAENRFKIIGHTDKSGSDEYNLYLSNARAREVKRHLVEECALPAEALLAVGEGERQSAPNAPANAPEERRVEIQFVS